MSKRKIQGDAAPSAASTASEEWPQQGGSYVRDPEAGTITRVEGPDLEDGDDAADQLDTDAPSGADTPSNSGDDQPQPAPGAGVEA